MAGTIRCWILVRWISGCRTLTPAIPDLDQRVGQASGQIGQGADAIKRLAGAASDDPGAPAKQPARGGTIRANLTPQQQALLGRKAVDCMQVLAFMDQGNIYPREFPNFQFNKMGQYRDAAKKMLGLMGPGGAEVVATQLRAGLMGQGVQMPDAGMHVHADYYSDLIDLLQSHVEQGEVPQAVEDSLREAASGRKDAAGAALAAKVEQALDAGANLTKLLEHWSGSRGCQPQTSDREPDPTSGSATLPTTSCWPPRRCLARPPRSTCTLPMRYPSG